MGGVAAGPDPPLRLARWLSSPGNRSLERLGREEGALRKGFLHAGRAHVFCLGGGDVGLSHSAMRVSGHSAGFFLATSARRPLWGTERQTKGGSAEALFPKLTATPQIGWLSSAAARTSETVGVSTPDAFGKRRDFPRMPWTALTHCGKGSPIAISLRANVVSLARAGLF